MKVLTVLCLNIHLLISKDLSTVCKNSCRDSHEIVQAHTESNGLGLFKVDVAIADTISQQIRTAHRQFHCEELSPGKWPGLLICPSPCLNFLSWKDLNGVDPLKDPFSNTTIVLSFYCNTESGQCIDVGKGTILAYSSLIDTAIKADIPLGTRVYKNVNFEWLFPK